MGGRQRNGNHRKLLQRPQRQRAPGRRPSGRSGAFHEPPRLGRAHGRGAVSSAQVARRNPSERLRGEDGRRDDSRFRRSLAGGIRQGRRDRSRQGGEARNRSRGVARRRARAVRGRMAHRAGRDDLRERRDAACLRRRRRSGGRQGRLRSRDLHALVRCGGIDLRLRWRSSTRLRASCGHHGLHGLGGRAFARLDKCERGRRSRGGG